VKEAFNGMASINRELASGSINARPLQSDEARELLESVYLIGKHPMVLVFDQWEKSPAIEAGAKILEPQDRGHPPREESALCRETLFSEYSGGKGTMIIHG